MLDFLLFIVGLIMLVAIWKMNFGKKAPEPAPKKPKAPGTARKRKEPRPAPPPIGTPTIPSGDYTFEIAGESHRQKALVAACGGKTPDGPLWPEAIVELVPEPTNRYDKNAIKCLINGQHVGYIGKDDTEEIRPLVDACKSRGEKATVLGTFTGGWDDGEGDSGQVGLEISIDDSLLD